MIVSMYIGATGACSPRMGVTTTTDNLELDQPVVLVVTERNDENPELVRSIPLLSREVRLSIANIFCCYILVSFVTFLSLDCFLF